MNNKRESDDHSKTGMPRQLDIETQRYKNRETETERRKVQRDREREINQTKYRTVNIYRFPSFHDNGYNVTDNVTDV